MLFVFLRKFLILIQLLVLFLSFSTGASDSLAQTPVPKDSAHLIIPIEKTRSFFVIPLIGYAQETSLSFGASALYSFYADKQTDITRQSNIFIGGTYTLNKQSNYMTFASIWSPHNHYHYVVDAYINRFPFNFFGIGNRTKASELDKINNIGSRIALEAEKQLGKIFYVGLTASYQNDLFQDIGAPGIFTSDPVLAGRYGGKELFAGISAIYDTRDFATYSTKGHYVRMNVSFAPKVGPDFYALSRYQFQSRSFYRLGSKKHTLAIHTLCTSLQGPVIPFYMTGTFGGINVMRGYYTGRFRDQNVVTTQVEYRWWPFKKIAFVPFVGTGEVFKNDQFAISELKPNYGIGGRYFFDLKARLTVRIDYGWGEKRAGEKRSQGLLFAVSESF